MAGKKRDAYEGMPIDLMMLVEARCGALEKYRLLDSESRAKIDLKNGALPGKEEKERLIDMIESGIIEIE